MKIAKPRCSLRVSTSARFVLFATGLLCIPTIVAAQDAALTVAKQVATPSPSVAAQDTASPPEAGKETSFWKRDTLTGDWNGARTALKDKYGTEVTVNYIGETLSVLSGGLHRHTSYEGRLELSLDTDLQTFAGWKGGSTHVTVFNIEGGRHNAEQNVGSIADPSNIDAHPTTRLFTVWFQQKLFDDRLSLRVGQLASDDEFFLSPTAGGLINATFGWTGMLGANIRSGGPAYPLSAPGVRIAIKPAERLNFVTAVFSGDPAGRHCNRDPQDCNNHGTTFSFSGGALWMNELQYATHQDKKEEGLPGIYKLGAWYATTGYADKHYGRNGVGGVVSLADPAAVAPLNHVGNWGLYGLADQTVARWGKRSLSMFLRTGIQPTDRNLISFHVDGGAGLKGLLPGRSDDLLTFGIAYRRISASAIALDRDMLATNGAPYPIRNYEMQVELDYSAQIAPWWTLQLDLQHIRHPGGRVPDPANPNLIVKGAFVAGVRNTVRF
jgi:porin